MKFKSLITVLLVLVGVAACTDGEPETTTISPNGFRVEKLFTHEGCSVYRFSDYRYVYYTVCDKDRHSSTATTYSKQVGKQTHYHMEEVETTFKD